MHFFICWRLASISFGLLLRADISTDSGEMKTRRVRVHFVSSVPKYRNSKLMFFIILFCEQNHNLEIECGNDILETFSGNFNDINIARNSDDSMRILFQCPRMRYDTARSEEKERVYSFDRECLCSCVIERVRKRRREYRCARSKYLDMANSTKGIDVWKRILSISIVSIVPKCDIISFMCVCVARCGYDICYFHSLISPFCHTIAVKCIYLKQF